MTGVLRDFKSSGGEDHPLIDWFKDAVEEFVQQEKRIIRMGIKHIREPMIAAGNVRTDEEAKVIVDLAVDNLKVYFDSYVITGETADKDETIKAQNYYCPTQQQNPTHQKVMKSLGLKEADVELFCTDALFPKIKD